MRHFGHGVGHLQYERQHEMETEIAVDVEDESQEETDHGPGEMDVDGYDSEAEISGGSDNGGVSSDDSDDGYTSF